MHCDVQLQLKLPVVGLICHYHTFSIKIWQKFLFVNILSK